MNKLKKYDKKADFRYFGGDLMQAQGGRLVKHYREMAFMGIFEVLANIRTIMKNMDACKSDIVNYQPDVVIFIDYPGFNLKIAKYTKSLNLKNFYYISPKIWAWKKSRGKQIKQYIDKMFVIFPFEKDFYKQFDYEVEFVGNPIIDALGQKLDKQSDKETFIKAYNLDGKPIVALLAGSRKQEIRTVLPIMLGVIKEFRGFEYIIAGAPGVSPDFYRQFTQGTNVRVLFDKTYAILKYSHSALVNSGTATLETALIGIPQIVCYKMAGGKLLYLFGKHFYGIKYVSLVNILLQKESVTELIQHLLTPENLKSEMQKLLYDETYRKNMIEDYNEIKQMLGGKGASERAAKKMTEILTKNTQ